MSLSFSGMSLSFSGMSLSFSGMSLSFSGMSLSFSGMSHSFSGMSLSFSGMSLSFPGMDRSFPGMDRSFPGMYRSFPGINLLFYGKYNESPVTLVSDATFRRHFLIAQNQDTSPSPERIGRTTPVTNRDRANRVPNRRYADGAPTPAPYDFRPALILPATRHCALRHAKFRRAEYNPE